ncbi:NUDIX hydrolase domain-like protein [Mycena amicta]|nr:NUDIX hydrolase domain-like protein [Mycena amicta]
MAQFTNNLPASSPYNLPIAAYLAANPTVTHLMGTVAVFFSALSESLRLLVVQRAPDDFLPLKWELPGGAVEPESDASVVAGALRELHEETGLTGRKVLRSLGIREFNTGGKTTPECIWRMCIFEVAVDGDGDGVEEGEYPAIKLDPAEHVAHLWVSEEEVRSGRCGDVVLEFTDQECVGILLRAFELHGTVAES